MVEGRGPWPVRKLSDCQVDPLPSHPRSSGLTGGSPTNPSDDGGFASIPGVSTARGSPNLDRHYAFWAQIRVEPIDLIGPIDSIDPIYPLQMVASER